LAVRTVVAAKTPQKAQRELEDLQLVLRARHGDGAALDALIRRYTSFVRLKASSYFLAGGDSEDLVQEGLIGLYKAVRDFRADKETSFRSFAELCVTRQIITAIKTATRYKHVPLNSYVSFSHTPAGQEVRARLEPHERGVTADQGVQRAAVAVARLEHQLEILELALRLLLSAESGGWTGGGHDFFWERLRTSVCKLVLC